MLVFHVDVAHNGKKYHLRVVHVLSTGNFDFYKVVGNNKTVTLRNNSPILNRHSLKYREPNWQVVEGDIRDQAFKEALIRAVSKYIRDLPRK